jgi:tetraacyldisaccharide 4'-kinase
VKQWLENYLLLQWYGNTRPNFLLFLLSGFYKGLQTCHHALYRTGLLKAKKIDCPVMVVGNFTAGGTGKTPFVIELVNALKALGWRPGVVSRGYGRSISTAISVEANSKTGEVGDEPLLIFKRTQCPVRVDKDRVAGAQLLQKSGCNVIVADDGLQHYRLHRDMEIEVIDGERQYGNGLLIPAGPLREQPRHCDFKIMSIANKIKNTDAGFFSMTMQLGTAYSLNGDAEKDVRELNGKNPIAIAGIGNPSRFFNAIKDKGVECMEQAMPDHHVFVQEDFQANATYLMTEKDAIKCRELNLPNAWVIPLVVSIDRKLFEQIDTKLKALT